MIVQPTSTNPRGQLGRALRIAGFVLPPVLLLVVVGAGIAGPRPEPTPPPASPPASIATGPTAPPPSMPSETPDVAAGLAVRTVAEAQPMLARADGAPIAIAGWLGSLQADAGCATATGDTRGILSPLCERRMRLEPGPAGSSAADHVHVLVPPGVRLPPPFEWPGADRADPVPVVLVGRAAPPDDPCVDSTRGCGERFTLDLVTWAGDAPFRPGVVFDAGLDVPPPAIAYRRQAEAEALVTGWEGTVLVSAVVRPATVAAIDPEAAAVMERGPSPEGLVWYVRGIETTYGPARFPPGDYPARERWVVLDETTGVTVATGTTYQANGTSRVDPPAPAPPRAVANLRVRSVSSFLASVANGRAPRVVALRGYLRAWADPRTCTRPVPGLPGIGCVRDAILADGPWAAGGDPRTAPAASLRAVVPAGVTVPESALDLDGQPEDAVPVVVVAHLEPSAAGCDAQRSGCRASVTIERVTWASGSRLALGRAVARSVSVAPDDPVAADPPATASRTMGPLTALVRVVLVNLADLAAVDPRAGRAVRAAGGHPGPVWYLRGIEVPYDPLLDPSYGRRAAELRWVVLDPGTGRVLARSTG